MTIVLIATESDDLFRNVDAALATDDVEVRRISRGADVVPTVQAIEPDFVLLDLQIGNMGGVAACIAVKQEEGFERLDPRPVALLLDRKDDIFMAQEAKADGWLIKPLDALRLRKLFTTLMAGDTYYEQLAGHPKP